MKSLKKIFFLTFLVFINSRFLEDKESGFAIELKETFDKENAVVDKGKEKFDEKISAEKLVEDMGFGWNLGNTLDAFNEKSKDQNEGLSSEKVWGNPETTEEMIQALIEKGFRTLRVPVTWHNHLVDEKYTIDPKWMARVKTIVDWGINNGMYVILNTHHDNLLDPKNELKYGQGYYPWKRDIKESEKFLYNVWTQIATAFNKGYDHHLVFEGLNEPRLAGNEYEWWYKEGEEVCEEAAEVLNEFNRLIVKAIRETGGNNEKRFIMVTALAASYQTSTTSKFVFPDDTKYNDDGDKIILSVHMYTPYNYALNGDMEYTRFDRSGEEELYEDFATLYKKFIAQGHHVIIGEMGTVNKNNTNDRIAWAEYYTQTSRKFHMSNIIWDNNIYDNTKSADSVLGHLHRDKLKWENDDIIDTHIAMSSTKFMKIKSVDDIYAIDVKPLFDKSVIIVDNSTKKKFDDEITDEQVSKEIGFGFNLGNSLDAYEENHPKLNEGLASEKVWGNEPLTEDMVAAFAKRGFHTFRVPTSWHSHMLDNDYTIDPEWMERVKTVVNWGIKHGLYVILNSHHDNLLKPEKPLEYGQGYYPTRQNIKESERFLYNIWTQIATAFNDGYDHHLIFESLNEPRIAGNKYEWWYKNGEPICEEAADVLNEFNRLIVKAIRETGGNNEKRFILIPALAASYQISMNSNFTFPDDSMYNDKQKIMLSVHMYIPNSFCFNDPTHTNFTKDDEKEIYDDFSNLYNKYIKKGYQVVIGEFGGDYKDNVKDRLAWAEYYVCNARKFHMSCIYWDNGVAGDNDKDGEFSRSKLKFRNDDIIDIYLNCTEKEFEKDPK